MDIRKNLILILVPLMLCACQNKKTRQLDLESMVNYVPIQTHADGRWGMMTTDGVIVFEDEFIEKPTVAVNGLFSVAEESGLALYAAADQPRLIGDCENMQFIGFCSQNLVPVVAAGQRIRLVKPDGTTRFTLEPIDNKEIVGCANVFNDDRLVIVDQDGLYGCVDTDGNVVISPKYIYLDDFSDGTSVAVRADSSYTIIDINGNTLADLHDHVRVVKRNPKRGCYVVMDQGGALSFMDDQGQLSKLPTKVKAVGEISDDYFTYLADNGLWGLMGHDASYQMLMRPKFRDLTILPDKDTFLVDLDGSWSIINLQGKKIVDFGDSYQSVIYPGFKGAARYFAKDNAGWVLLDEAGAEIHTDFDIYDIVYDVTEAMASGALGTTTARKEVSFVDEVVAQITPNSLCGIRINAAGNSFYSKQSPDSLVNTKEFIPDSIPDLSALGDIMVVGVTDRLISVAVRFNNATQKVEYAFQPVNTVAAIELDIVTANTGVFLSTRDEMTSALEQIGFRKVEESDDAVIYRSRYANLEISLDNEDKTITVLMYRL